MGEFSLTHWLIILVILMLFFGPSRLPQLGSSLGKALRGFKEGLNEKEKEAQAEMRQQDANSRLNETPPRPTQNVSQTHVREPEQNT